MSSSSETPIRSQISGVVERARLRERVLDQELLPVRSSALVRPW